jgi:hypothetical protein
LQYDALLSIKMHFRESASAAIPVVPLPANGSTTKPAGGQSRRMKNNGKSIGKTAGCPLFFLRVLQ